MQEIMNMIVINLEQVGVGAGLFLAVYLSNMMLGAWRSVRIDGLDFNWMKIGESIVKFAVLGLGIALLSVAVSIIPMYVEYIGLTIDEETLTSIDAIVIVGAFLTATIRYIVDCINKLKEILDV